MAPKNNPDHDNDLSGLIPILILFCIPSGFTQIIGLIMLAKMASRRNWFARMGAFFQNLFTARPAQTRDEGWAQDPWAESSAKGGPASGSSQARSGQTGSAGAGVHFAGEKSSYSYSYSAPSSGKSKGKKKLKKPGKAPGTGLIIGGAVSAGVFLIGFISTLVEMIQYGGWYELPGVTATFLFMLGFLGMMFTGIGMNGRAERYAAYLAYIGANREVDLARMAANLDVPVKKLCRDLRKMLAKGMLPTGYIDLAEGKLFLTEMGYRPAEPVKKAEPEPEPEPVRSQADEDAILKEIRQVNDFIPDEAMSEKIDRIEEITRKILAYQKKHPDRAGQLRSFLNYYLPTTLKILRAYAQLDAQGVEGENISAAKGRIEGMMDQVVYGFEKQLDKLFQEDAMDVAADVEVLENMLKKDGLSNGEGITLEM